MSKNLKTLLCCVLSLVFVAGTIVAVFADSNSLIVKESESLTNEDVTADETTTVVEETTIDEETTVEEETSAEETTKPEETTDEPGTDVEPSYRLGDVNFDGKITAADARLALRMSAKLETPTDVEFIVADVIVDGKIEAADARLILRVSARVDAESAFGQAA